MPTPNVRIHGIDTQIFGRHVAGRRKVIFPWPLSIVDCHFLAKAFLSAEDNRPACLRRISVDGEQVQQVIVAGALDLYNVDRDAAGIEVVLSNSSGACCYWDTHERFVLAAGPPDFLSIAQPYPLELAKHRFVEEMTSFGVTPESGEYDSLFDNLLEA